MNDNLIQQAVLGTEDYHALMREVTVHSLRQQAGYVAPVLTEDDGLPKVEYMGTGEFPVFVGMSTRVGTVHYVQMLMNCCSHCRFYIGKFLLDDTTYVYSEKGVTHCEICGDKVTP